MRDVDEVMTAQEVAAYLKVAVRTVYALVKEGALPAFKVGRVLRCRRSEVESFIRRQVRVDSKQLAAAAAENGGRR